MKRKRGVIIVDGESANWREHMDTSPAYACYVTAAVLRQPLFWDRLAYAKEQGKPVLACVEAGTTLPPGLFAGIKPCLIVEVASPEETAQWVIRFMQMYLPKECYA